MPVDAKPAAGDGGCREIVISNWRLHQKNSLRAFFTATLPSGLVLHNLMLHEKDCSRWIGFPAREWTSEQGGKQFAKLIEFAARATATRFRDHVLAAIDRHLESSR
jgi:hypothetical protein